MKVKTTFYFSVIDDLFIQKLKPTGKWKLVCTGGEYSKNDYTYSNQEYDLYIEHQGFIFKKWVHEKRITFRFHGEFIYTG